MTIASEGEAGVVAEGGAVILGTTPGTFGPISFGESGDSFGRFVGSTPETVGDGVDGLDVDGGVVDAEDESPHKPRIIVIASRSYERKSSASLKVSAGRTNANPCFNNSALNS